MKGRADGTSLLSYIGGNRARHPLLPRPMPGRTPQGTNPMKLGENFTHVRHKVALPLT